MKRFIILFLFCLCAGLLNSCSTSDEKNPPNILFIAVDDLRPELGCYGKEYVKSPSIDRLAENGIRFTQMHNTSKCFPSRATLLTGVYAQQCGYEEYHQEGRIQQPEYEHNG